jgi:tight adherence protein B
MSEVVALTAGATLFVVLQAGYWMNRADRAQLDALLRTRLGGGQTQAPLLLQKNRARSMTLSALLEQTHLGWSEMGLVGRATVLAGLGALLGVFVGGAVFVFVFIILALGGLYLFLLRARDARMRKVDAQLPRALEIMVLALRAGQSLPRAVALSAEELPAPMGEELTRVADEQALGRPIEEAFAAMSSRLPGSEAVRTLTSGISVLLQSGGNLVEIIERILEAMSAQAAYRMRLRAVTAEGRSSGMMLIALPLVFAILAVACDASYVKLFLEESTGHLLMTFAIGLWLAGALWIQRLLSES